MIVGSIRNNFIKIESDSQRRMATKKNHCNITTPYGERTQIKTVPAWRSKMNELERGEEKNALSTKEHNNIALIIYLLCKIFSCVGSYMRHCATSDSYLGHFWGTSEHDGPIGHTHFSMKSKSGDDGCFLWRVTKRSHQRNNVPGHKVLQPWRWCINPYSQIVFAAPFI